MCAIFLTIFSLFFSYLSLYSVHTFEFYNVRYDNCKNKLSTYWRTNITGISRSINYNNVEIMARSDLITFRLIPARYCKDKRGRVLLGHFLKSASQDSNHLTIYRYYLSPTNSSSGYTIVVKEPAIKIKQFLIELLVDFINDRYVAMRKVINPHQKDQVLAQIHAYNNCFLNSSL